MKEENKECKSSNINITDWGSRVFCNLPEENICIYIFDIEAYGNEIKKIPYAKELYRGQFGKYTILVSKQFKNTDNKNTTLQLYDKAIEDFKSTTGLIPKLVSINPVTKAELSTYLGYLIENNNKENEKWHDALYEIILKEDENVKPGEFIVE